MASSWEKDYLRLLKCAVTEMQTEPNDSKFREEYSAKKTSMEAFQMAQKGSGMYEPDIEIVFEKAVSRKSRKEPAKRMKKCINKHQSKSIEVAVKENSLKPKREHIKVAHRQQGNNEKDSGKTTRVSLNPNRALEKVVAKEDNMPVKTTLKHMRIQKYSAKEMQTKPNYSKSSKENSAKNSPMEAFQMAQKGSSIYEPDFEIIFEKVASGKSRKEPAKRMKKCINKHQSKSIEVAVKENSLKPKREHIKVAHRQQGNNEKDSGKTTRVSLNPNRALEKVVAKEDNMPVKTTLKHMRIQKYSAKEMQTEPNDSKSCKEDSAKNSPMEAFQMAQKGSNIYEQDFEIIFEKVVSRKSREESAKGKKKCISEQQSKSVTAMTTKDGNMQLKKIDCSPDMTSPRIINMGEGSTSRIKAEKRIAGKKIGVHKSKKLRKLFEELDTRECCCVCKGYASGTDSPLAFCHDCGKHFHKMCHIPTLDNINVSDFWICSSCWWGQDTSGTLLYFGKSCDSVKC